MADKTKTTTLKSKTETPTDLPLPEQLAKKRTELLEARKNLGSTLANPHAITKLRKDIARIMTKINATKGTN